MQYYPYWKSCSKDMASPCRHCRRPMVILAICCHVFIHHPWSTVQGRITHVQFLSHFCPIFVPLPPFAIRGTPGLNLVGRQRSLLKWGQGSPLPVIQGESDSESQVSSIKYHAYQIKPIAGLNTYLSCCPASIPDSLLPQSIQITTSSLTINLQIPPQLLHRESDTQTS